jgi:hypothetical protein
VTNQLLWTRLVRPLAFVLAITITFLAVLYLHADVVKQGELEAEAGKAMINVIAAVLIGNIVLVIIRDFEERRKEWLAKRDLLQSDLTDGLLELYSRVKGARRRLRASVTEGQIETQKYDEQLQDISDTQLALEGYKREAEGGVRAGLLPKSLPDELKSMEEYLGNLVTEYEGAHSSKETDIPLAKLPSLMEFIGPYAKSDFRSMFVHPYYRTAHAVSQEIEKDLPRSKANTALQ